MFEFYLPLIDKETCLSWRVDIAPCQAACPLGIDVEGYIKAIGEGDFKKAIHIIRERCPLPSVCGRVCHHPCETECKRGKVDQPLAIRDLKRAATDQGRGEKSPPEPVLEAKREKIAIIGSGPAGLTAAHDLVKQGYGVTIFEALPIAGGMLVCGIPEFDLPQEIVQEEIDSIRDLGVEIRTNTPIGGEITFADLVREGYRAILIATGAQGSARLPIPGVDLEGVISALPFLQEAKIGKKPSLKGKVVVIGGGNVAIDAARTALRLGAEKVDLICVESRGSMPAFEWMIKIAEAEGVQIHPSLAPQQLRSNNGKRVSSLDLQQVVHSERDRDGRVTWALRVGTGSALTVEMDWVIVAIGQKADLFNGGGNLETSPRGTLTVDAETLATSQEGTFAAGDIVAFPSTVVESMALGRKAALAIHRFLQGEDLEKAGPACP
jgi:NADPH-dependent glutamate synthase beta subunit-like oxidoreductase